MFQPLIELYLQMFLEKGGVFLKAVVNTKVPGDILVGKYSTFKQEDKIDALDEDEKRKLWELAKELLPDETTAYRMRACKIIHCIGTLIA
jgi:hypothetical protein